MCRSNYLSLRPGSRELHGGIPSHVYNRGWQVFPVFTNAFFLVSCMAGLHGRFLCCLPGCCIMLPNPATCLMYTLKFWPSRYHGCCSQLQSLIHCALCQALRNTRMHHCKPAVCVQQISCIAILDCCHSRLDKVLSSSGSHATAHCLVCVHVSYLNCLPL